MTQPSKAEDLWLKACDDAQAFIELVRKHGVPNAMERFPLIAQVVKEIASKGLTGGEMILLVMTLLSDMNSQYEEMRRRGLKPSTIQ